MATREIVIYGCERCGFEQAFPKLDDATHVTAHKYGWKEVGIPIRENSYPPGRTDIRLYRRMLCAKCNEELERLLTEYHERVMKWYCSTGEKEATDE